MKTQIPSSSLMLIQMSKLKTHNRTRMKIIKIRITTIAVRTTENQQWEYKDKIVENKSRNLVKQNVQKQTINAQMYCIKVSGNNTQQRTTTETNKHKINQEIKFIYCKGTKIKPTITHFTTQRPAALYNCNNFTILKFNKRNIKIPWRWCRSSEICRRVCNVIWYFNIRSTTDHIFCIRQILEKKWEYNEAVH